MKRQPDYSLSDLLYLMTRLREPETGCPWDMAQSYKTIAPSTIEEAYEVVDAIESEDYGQLREELGDFLFQVIFYSELAREEGRFEFSDIVDGLTGKLIRRHPHVFPDGDLNKTFSGERSADDEQKIKAQWEAIKREERNQKGLQGVLDDVPVTLPAIARAAKLQKRASGVGFDWSDIAPVFDKVTEELEEVRSAWLSGDEQAASEEIGDLLFSVVNLARHMKVDSESALRHCNRKFETRFGFIEQTLKKQGLAFDEVSLQDLDELWNKAKTTP